MGVQKGVWMGDVLSVPQRTVPVARENVYQRCRVFLCHRFTTALAIAHRCTSDGFWLGGQQRRFCRVPMRDLWRACRPLR